ncbi:hypothetical protein [Corynebacterium sp. TAE3-ERU16]|uniref:hypothetical protein n=1 Tax=Corynebacterium sp. TAE3-ERU16 TaxID=2849493 RepID=UPI001C437894|nr:hypothetical protein [Corynebacterium sp. TAE3-ERU16]MBV7293575.1 hypothetical protein [Corynebacterium sp. TAE3-ERU16]
MKETTPPLTDSATAQVSSTDSQVSESPSAFSPETSNPQGSGAQDSTPMGEVEPQSLLEPTVAAPQWLQGTWNAHSRSLEVSPEGAAGITEHLSGELGLDVQLRLVTVTGDQSNGHVTFQVEGLSHYALPPGSPEFPIGKHILFTVENGVMYGERGYLGNFCTGEARGTPARDGLGGLACGV